MANHEADVTRFQKILRPESQDQSNVENSIDKYNSLFDQKNGGDVDARRKNYQVLVNNFYDLVTDFYEYGWGQSFHFAPRYRNESFDASLSRHEMYLAHRLNLGPEKLCLDLGCGVGGPARTISLFSGAHIHGLNNNQYQINRCKKLAEAAGLSRQTDFTKGDFMNIPFKENTFDAAYAIEALCHAPDLVAVYKQIFGVLKPGGLYGGYEWAMTDMYDPKNATHREVKFGVENGNGLPCLPTCDQVVDALKKAGFEVLEARDIALVTATQPVSWFYPLTTFTFSLKGIAATSIGRWMTHKMLWGLETLRIAPRGATKVQNMLEIGASQLVRAGQTGIMTPAFFVLCRKPLSEDDGAS